MYYVDGVEGVHFQEVVLAMLLLYLSLPLTMFNTGLQCVCLGIFTQIGVESTIRTVGVKIF